MQVDERDHDVGGPALEFGPSGQVFGAGPDLLPQRRPLAEQRFMSDVDVRPAVVLLGRHLQTITFRASTSSNWLQMFEWRRTNLSTIIVLPMSLSP